MKFTGERFIPTEQGRIRLEHYHRYAIVLDIVNEKDVLDLACGEGYGSFLIAKAARSVTGVDISVETIQHAAKTYKRSNLKFNQGSATALDFPDSSFDVVVSFETIEHLAEQEEMIAEIRRVLHPDGILIISSPNRPVYNKVIGDQNEFHVKELDFGEFDELLKLQFPAIVYSAQQFATGSIIRPLHESKAKFQAWQNNNGGLKNTTGDPSIDAVYFIAFCASDKFLLPAIQPSVLHPEKSRIANPELTQIGNLQKTIESLIIDRDSQKSGFETLRKAFENLVHERDALVEQLNTTITEKDQLVENLGETIDSLIEDRDAQKNGLEALRESFDELTREREGERAEYSKELSLVSSSLAQKEDVITTLRNTVESLIVDRDAQKSGYEKLRSLFDETVRAQAEKSLELNTEILEKDSKINSLSSELEDMYKSNSWRLTAPLRKIVRMVSPQKGYLTFQPPIPDGEALADERAVNESPLNRSISESLSLNEAPSHNGTGHPTLDRSTSEKLNFDQPPSSNGSGRPTPKRFRILLVSYYCPTRAHAGGLRLLDIYNVIKTRRPDVQIDLLTHQNPSIDWSLDEAKQLFDNIYFSPSELLTPAELDPQHALDEMYDIVDLQFLSNARQADAFRKVGHKIIFTPMESLARAFFIDWSSKNGRRGDRLSRVARSFRAAYEEVGFVGKVDEVVCVSKPDAAFLRGITGAHNVKSMDTGVSQFEFGQALSPDFEVTNAVDRKCRILYVAYFGSETNVIALRWYLANVHNLVKKQVPDYVLTVVGRGDLSAFSDYKDSSVELVGEVPTLAPYIQESRLGIAPALSGSGFRGKINQYTILGVPCVVSPISSKGLAYRDGENIFVADNPDVFAERCSLLLTDLELNDRMGKAARNLCLRRYTWQSKWNTIRKIYNLEELG